MSETKEKSESQVNNIEQAVMQPLSEDEKQRKIAERRKVEGQQVACVEQTKVPDMTKEDIDKRLEELKAELKLSNEKLLSGKCPIRIMEQDGVTKWDYTCLKEPFDSYGKAFKHLTATTDYDLAVEIIFKGVSALPSDRKEAGKYNLILQSLADSAPKDATEARLCVQATALYSQGMSHLSRAENSNNFVHSEYYMKNAVKLLRLHNETIEAISKHRRGGEQRVVVQHVQVNEGGQAIVGGTVNGGRG